MSVAAMDRQHPRDLFDVWQLFESDGLSDAMIECFVTYLAGHNRPIHGVLFGNEKEITAEYQNNFIGMTTDPVSLTVLLETRKRLRTELAQRLTDNQRQFLIGLARAQPDCSLVDCAHAAELPALRWKLENLKAFRKSRPEVFEQHARALEDRIV